MPISKKYRCKQDQLFGVWAIDGDVLHRLESKAQEIIASGKLAQVQDDTSEMIAEEPLYQTQGDVAVLSLEGPLTKHDTSFKSAFGGTSTVRVREAIRAAVKDPAIKTLVYDVDSPGGTTLGLPELVGEVERAAKVKRSVAYASGDMTSGALWATLPLKEVYASPTSNIGSIGTFFKLNNRSAQLKSQGVVTEVFSDAPLKGVSEDTEITPAQRTALQERAVAAGKPFHEAVMKYRGMTAEQETQVADGGRVYNAQAALERGLIHGVCLEHDLYERLKSNKPAAPSPQKDTMFNDEQLAALQAIDANVTQETAPAFVLSTIQGLQAKLANAPKAQVIDADVLAQACEVAEERFDLLVEKAKMTPAQRTAIGQVLRSADKKPNAAMFAKVGDKPLYKSILEVFDAGVVQTEVGEKTDKQPQPTTRITPGDADKDTSYADGLAQGKAIRDRMLAAQGIK